jgi:hypothetical protein
MKTSETMGKFNKAFADLQNQITGVAKDGVNPHFGNKYTTLESVIDYLKPILNATGFTVMQSLDILDGGQAVSTRLVHVESGEWIQSETICPVKDPTNPQHLGSAVTYLRRYQLKAATGMSEIDSDGNLAAGHSETNSRSAKPGQASLSKSFDKPKARAKAKIDSEFDKLRETLLRLNDLERIESARTYIEKEKKFSPAEKKAGFEILDIREKLIKSLREA